MSWEMLLERSLEKTPRCNDSSRITFSSPEAGSPQSGRAGAHMCSFQGAWHSSGPPSPAGLPFCTLAVFPAQIARPDARSPSPAPAA